jgi:hypothetical protein
MAQAIPAGESSHLCLLAVGNKHSYIAEKHALPSGSLDFIAPICYALSRSSTGWTASGTRAPGYLCRLLNWFRLVVLTTRTGQYFYSFRTTRTSHKQAQTPVI